MLMRTLEQYATSAHEPKGVSEPDGRLACPHLLWFGLQLGMHTADFKANFHMPQSQQS